MKKLGKKCLVSVFVLALVATGNSVDLQAKKSTKKPKLSATKLVLTVGKKKTLTVKNTSKVTWTISNKKIVTFSAKQKTKATVKALKAGTATITVKIKKKKLKCKVIVQKAVASSKTQTTPIPAIPEQTLAPAVLSTITPNDTTQVELSHKTFFAYTNDITTKNNIELSFMEGSTVPYISLQEFVRYTNESVLRTDKFGISESNEESIIEQPEHDIKMVFKEKEIMVHGYDAIDNMPLKYIADVEDNKAFYSAGAVVSSGKDFTIDLSKYHIATYQDKAGKRYIPFNTIADIIYGQLYITVAYNGDHVFVLNFGEYELEEKKGDGYQYTDLGKLYYANQDKAISKERVEYNYNELCLLFDTFYGLKDLHQIESFDDLLSQNGTKKLLLSEDSRERNKGYAKFLENDIGDNHSSYWYGGNYINQLEYGELDRQEALNSQYVPGSVRAKYAEYYWSRKQNYKDGQGDLKGYIEVGDTAYVTFDNFDIDFGKNYYTNENVNNMEDVAELIIYANKQLHREDCPVKNLVVDLSVNTGGIILAGQVLLSWMQRNPVPTYIMNHLSLSKTMSMSVLDANLDGVLGNEEDYVPKGIRLFCMISPVSFSCANFCPYILKNITDCTILGKRSAGGSNIVLPGASAEGMIFQTSSPYVLSTFYKNGAFYTSDEGVTPDVYISDVVHMYDREYLTEFIDQLP